MRPLLLLSIAIAINVSASSGLQAAERTIREWDFSTSSDTLGWANAESIKEFRVADGALRAVGEPGKHKFESPLFDIPAKPSQYVEIELKTDADGTALMYYSNTTEEPYHGFRPAQYTHFNVIGDGAYRTYTVRPFWHNQGKITHVRIDPPGTSVSVRAVRIIDLDTGEPTKATAWEFKDDLSGWKLIGAKSKADPADAFCRLTGDRETVFFSPITEIDSDQNLCVTLRVSSATSHVALFKFATSDLDGLHSVPVILRGDGQAHSYCLDLSDHPEWSGTILAAGLTPTESESPATISVYSVAFGEGPVGPPELEVTRFELADPVTRVGEKARLVVEVANTGGSEAQSIAALVTIPDSIDFDERTAATPKTETNGGQTFFPKRIAKLGPGQTAKFEWEFTVESDAPRIAVCRVTGKDLDAGEKQIDLRFYPKVDKAKLAGVDYVPRPMPANTGNYLVGCYYFPGWHNYDRWTVLDDYPERRPVLGYYREGEPQVADWQMKWALEHGIGFFIYDWYWSQGARQLEHALHDGYLNSRFKDKMKFCLLWANHNPAKTSSEADCINVTRYWIENYFKLPNYLKVDGKNVMVIFSPHRLTEDMGSDAVKAAFGKMRKMCEDAGVGGLYLVACTYPGGHIKNLVDEGYDALSGYNYPGANNKGQQYAPYEWMVEGYKDYWNQIADAAAIPYIPVCEPGWDARPWHGLKSFVRTGKSPFLWKSMLENAKAFVDDPRRKQEGDRKLVFLEAWNEFGEGDYIEPHAEFGFAYLEAVREVFAPNSPKPEIIVPKDLGMGPYEVKKTEPRSAWDFSKPDDQTWTTGNMKDFYFRDGVMMATAANSDPAFYSPQTRINAAKYRTVEIKMRMNRGNEAQLFFCRPRGKMTEERSVRFPVAGDDQFHVYSVDMSSNQRWRGTIGQLRLDPNSEAGSTVEVAYVKLK
jgi:hypothetical protein